MSMKPNTFSIAVLTALAIALFPAGLADEGFSIKETDFGLTINYDGELVTNYIVDQANKPYLWPFIGPTGSL